MDEKNLNNSAATPENIENTTEKSEKKPSKPKRPGQGLFEWSQALAVSICAIVLIFTFIARVIGVDGISMEPTLNDQDRLIVYSLFFEPEAGDIVVLHSDNYSNPLIKRVIAKGGQTVRLEAALDLSVGNLINVYVDGELLEEDYINENMISRYDFPLDEDVIVPEGCVFVMGDNRNHSSDSRSNAVGMVDERQIIGKAIFRLYPFDKLGVL